MNSDASDAGGSDGEEEKAPPKKVYRFADLLQEVPNGDVAAAAQLLLTERGLTSVESLEALRSLRKLELRGNHLTSLGFLEMNHALCWLGLAKNRLRRLSNLQNLSSLAVLDISDNRITRLEGLEGLTGLKAIIATRNRITQISGLAPKKHPALETIVLSNNRLTECRLSNFKNLRKLSVAHNQLHAFPELKGLPALAELRLNGNRVCSVAENLSYLPALSILDVGNNLLSKASQLEPLRGLLRVKSLNLLGNAVASDMESPALKSVLESLKSLEIVNNRRLAGESQKKRRQPGADKAKAAPKPQAKIAVHGRAFEGRRAVFDDEDEDEGPADTQARAESHNGKKTDKKKQDVGRGPSEVRAKSSAESVEVAKRKKKGQKKQGVDRGASEVRAKSSSEGPEVVKRRKKGKKKHDNGTSEPKLAKRKAESSGELRPKAPKTREGDTASKPKEQDSVTRTHKVKRKKRKVSVEA